MRQRKPLYANLTVQVLAAVVIGILLGYFRPSLAVEMKPLGDVFVRLIKMVIGPIVFLTVVAGIAQAGDMRKVGRIGLKALLYFEVVTTVCLLIGIVVAHVIRPGAGIAMPHVQASDLAQFTKPQGGSIIDFLVHVVPDNAFAAFANGDVLQVLIFAVLFGAGLIAVGEPGVPLAHALERLSSTLFRVISIVMRVAPIGAFGAMAFTIGRFGLGALAPLATLMLTIYITMALFVVIVLGSIARLAGFSIFALLRTFRDELLLVLGTSSTETVLPQLMDKLVRIGCSRTTVGLVVPTGYSFNQDGSAIYLSVSALFIAQVYGIDLSLGQEAGLFAVLMLTSKGAAGITGSGFVVLAGAVAASGVLPVEGLALLLGVERFMSEARALTNLVGNTVATLVIARHEGEITYAAIGPAVAAPFAAVPVSISDAAAPVGILSPDMSPQGRPVFE
jgi:aerobic C4-dicarboxylate transport protein